MNFEVREKLQSSLMMLLLLGPAFLVIPIVIFGPLGTLSFLLIVFGGFLILSTKLSLKGRTRILIEWGCNGMLKSEKRRYVFGYGFLLVGVIISLFAFLWYL